MVVPARSGVRVGYCQNYAPEDRKVFRGFFFWLFVLNASLSSLIIARISSPMDATVVLFVLIGLFAGVSASAIIGWWFLQRFKRMEQTTMEQRDHAYRKEAETRFESEKA